MVYKILLLTACVSLAQKPIVISPSIRNTIDSLVVHQSIARWDKYKDDSDSNYQKVFLDYIDRHGSDSVYIEFLTRILPKR
jgi:hypothetical protein